MAKINISHTSRFDITTPASGTTSLFIDTDNVLKQKDDAGNIQIIGTTGYTAPMIFSGLNDVHLINPQTNDLLYWSGGAVVNDSRVMSGGTDLADIFILQGSTASSGYSGYSGYSGSGASGYSGYSGAGTSGYSGYSGYSGSGVSGYSGYSGYSGKSGYSGYSGIGTSGYSGYSGYSGSGVSGYSGYSGYSGKSGYSGYSGSGVSGYSGYSGYSGISGYSGYSGVGSPFWTLMPGTPVRASNTSFTVTGDITAYVAKGMVIKWTESATTRNAMVSIPSTYGSATTITIIGDTMASIDASSLKYALIGAEPFIARFAYAGNVGTVGTDVMNSYTANEPMRVLGADMQAGTAGSTNSTTVNIVNGTGTVTLTSPTLGNGIRVTATPAAPASSALSLALNDRIQVDVTAIQSTNAIDLYAQLYLFPTRYNNLT